MLKINTLILLVFFINTTKAQTVNNNSELQTAITNASAGSTIILANGTWTDINININKTGTLANPVTIKAENANQVFFEGDCNISLGGDYIFFEGIVFQNASGLDTSNSRIEPIIEFRDTSNNECNNCKVTNIKINSYNGTVSQEEDIFKWILVYGQYNEISYSSFIGKNGVGSIINDNRNDTDSDYTKIHHNYFASRTPVGIVNALNDQDAIRIGNSSTSLSDSYTEIYDNFFYDWSGEVEIISNKSGKNKYYNNTFKDYQGTLTLRHGNECEVYDNFFFADNNLFSGGIRVIGENHKIYNNYIEGVNSEKPGGGDTKTAGAINITNGRPSSALSGYYQVKNTTIVNNTFVNCDYGLRVGTNVGGDLTLAPENLIIGNNIMINTSDNGYDEQTAPTGSSVTEGNIKQGGASSWDLTNGTNGNQTVASGLLSSGTNFYEVPSGSATINAGVGSYAFLTNDILGGIRTIGTGNFDAGAEEFGASGPKTPYKVSDVGTKVGFTPYSSSNFTSVAGDVIINEILINPSGSESEREWIELHNTTGSDINIDGWILRDRSSSKRAHLIDNSGSLIIPANGYIVIGNEANITGLTIAYDYGYTSNATFKDGSTVLYPATGSPTFNNSNSFDDGVDGCNSSIDSSGGISDDELDGIRLLMPDVSTTGDLEDTIEIDRVEYDFGYNSTNLVASGGTGQPLGVPFLPSVAGWGKTYTQLEGSGCFGTNSGEDENISLQRIAITGNSRQQWAMSDSSSTAGDYSGTPGAVNNASAVLSNNWLGTTSVWNTASNWSKGSVPIATDDVYIPSGTASNPIISGTTGAVGYNVVVATGATLTISSGGSLIVTGISTGNITYNRNLTFTTGLLEGWHLIGSPVIGQTYNDAFVTANNIAGNNSNRGIATYNNSVNSNNWVYFQSEGSGTFGAASGYSVKTSTTADVSFTGTLNTSNVTKEITIGAGTPYNLIANPFTSYINSATFLTSNTGLLTSQTIWLWNPSTKNYDAKVTIDDFQLAPGQGFFVSCGTAGNVSFANLNQTHINDTFLKKAKTEINLLISDGSNNRYTKLYYTDKATKGFDNGFDGQTFNGISNNFDVFTHLVSNNVGDNYQIQSLPIADLESMIIPVGVKSAVNKEITFSVETLNLQNNVNIFLEDRLTATYTQLNEVNATYKVTIDEAIDGVGRFYLHTSSKSSLSLDDSVQLNNISIYKSNTSTIRITGLQEGNSTIKLFNILGKQLINESFNSNGVKDIYLPKLSIGVYIVQLETELGKLNKKIIIE